jgi:hypothetical protein
MRVPDNRVLRRIFGPKRRKMAGGWRGLHNMKLQKILLGDKVEEDEMIGACRTHWRNER